MRKRRKSHLFQPFLGLKDIVFYLNLNKTCAQVCPSSIFYPLPYPNPPISSLQSRRVGIVIVHQNLLKKCLDLRMFLTSLLVLLVLPIVSGQRGICKLRRNRPSLGSAGLKLEEKNTIPPTWREQGIRTTCMSLNQIFR